MKNTGGRWSYGQGDACTSQEMLRIVSKYEKLEKARKDSLLEPPERPRPC